MRKKLYNSINICVFIIGVIFFVLYYKNLSAILGILNLKVAFILFMTVIIVHGLKGFRLYFELYEKKMPINLFIRQYCKVIPISMILPFKMGDVFRVYCYGYNIKNYMVGVAVIVLDRFVDTIALITVVFLLYLILNIELTKVIYILIFMIILLIVCYLACPSMLSYWKKYFIKSKATKYSIEALNFIVKFQRVYKELQEIVSGKFLIIYIISVFAWGTEIGGLIWFSNTINLNSSKSIGEYLKSAIIRDNSLYLNSIIFISTILFFFIYCFIFCIDKMRKDKCNE